MKEVVHSRPPKNYINGFSISTPKNALLGQHLCDCPFDQKAFKAFARIPPLLPPWWLIPSRPCSPRCPCKSDPARATRWHSCRRALEPGAAFNIRPGLHVTSRHPSTAHGRPACTQFLAMDQYKGTSKVQRWFFCNFPLRLIGFGILTILVPLFEQDKRRSTEWRCNLPNWLLKLVNSLTTCQPRMFLTKVFWTKKPLHLHLIWLLCLSPSVSAAPKRRRINKGFWLLIRQLACRQLANQRILFQIFFVKLAN